MSKLDNLKIYYIVGFDERIGSPCGRCRPIVLESKSAQYYISTPSEKDTDFELLGNKNDIKNLEKDLRVTLFEEEFQLFEKNAVVLFIREDLENLISLPKEFQWVNVGGNSRTELTFRVSIVPFIKGLEILNNWGNSLLFKLNNFLCIFLQDRMEDKRIEAEKMALLAHSAAKDENLKIPIYLRMGLIYSYSPTPEKLFKVYNLTKKKSSLRWKSIEDFRKEIQDLENFLLTKGREFESNPGHLRPPTRLGVKSVIRQIREFRVSNPQEVYLKLEHKKAQNWIEDNKDLVSKDGYVDLLELETLSSA